MSNTIYQVCYIEYNTYSYTGEIEETSLVTLNAEQALNRFNTYDKSYIYIWESKDGINYKGTKEYTPEQFKDKYLK